MAERGLKVTLFQHVLWKIGSEVEKRDQSLHWGKSCGLSSHCMKSQRLHMKEPLIIPQTGRNFYQSIHISKHKGTWLWETSLEKTRFNTFCCSQIFIYLFIYYYYLENKVADANSSTSPKVKSMRTRGLKYLKLCCIWSSWNGLIYKITEYPEL